MVEGLEVVPFVSDTSTVVAAAAPLVEVMSFLSSVFLIVCLTSPLTSFFEVSGVLSLFVLLLLFTWFAVELAPLVFCF